MRAIRPVVTVSGLASDIHDATLLKRKIEEVYLLVCGNIPRPIVRPLKEVDYDGLGDQMDVEIMEGGHCPSISLNLLAQEIGTVVQKTVVFVRVARDNAPPSVQVRYYNHAGVCAGSWSSPAVVDVPVRDLFEKVA